jgi:hypothetical protein
LIASNTVRTLTANQATSTMSMVFICVVQLDAAIPYFQAEVENELIATIFRQ